MSIHNVLFPLLLLCIIIELPCIRCNPKNVKDINGESLLKDVTTTKCTLYLGESTIPNAGLGIFSAIDIPKDSKIGTGDLVIPLFDKKFSTLLGSYSWNGKDQCSHNEAELVDNLCPGVQAIVNGHTALMNVWAGHVDNDACGLHRSIDPGVGAFSYYHNLLSYATAPILAGMELFADYGDHWFAAKVRGGKFDKVPLSYDYEEADTLLAKFDGFMKDEGDDIDDEAMDTFWMFYRKKVSSNKRVSSLLPEDIKNMRDAAEIGSAKFHTPTSIRSPEWLESKGLCMDNLKEGISNIPQAGRGAFATRFLPKGSFVAPMPLMHECKVDAFLSGGKTQVLLNYCFGHKSSTITLCPYGPLASLINHNKVKANVEIRWSTSTKLYSDEWLHMNKEELCNMGHSSLLFDVVAIKDIQQGEEVYFNYGQEWDDAWAQHIKNWIQPPDAKEYKSASMLNKEDMIRTIDEQKDNPYPDNVLLECFFKAPEEWEEINDAYYQNYSGYESYLDLHNCQILKREHPTYDTTIVLYTASVYYQPDNGEHYNVTVRNIPRNSIKFSDASYTSDMYLDNAFRHKIMIPDDIFPSGWKNLD